MTVALVQGADASTYTGTTLAPNIATPTQNNLLVANVFTKADGGITNPTGFTTAISVVNGTNADTLRIAYKVAGASEADPSWSGFSTSDATAASTYEFSGTDTSSPLDKTASTAVTTSVTSLSSGTTATLSQADEGCVAAFALRGQTTGAALNNSYTMDHALDANGEAGIITGYRIVAATTAQTTTGSWTDSLTAMGAIATFKATGGGGGATLRKNSLLRLGVGR